MIYTCTIETPLGPMTAAAENDAVTGLWFVGQKYYPAGSAQWACRQDHPVFAALQSYLSRYFCGETATCEVALAPQGSPFQQAVWAQLTRIPYGETVTYGTIAREIARGMGIATMSAQAVGGAVGHNPISILIPCHRVVGSTGKLTGYAGGVEKKEALLRLEAEHHPPCALC